MPALISFHGNLSAGPACENVGDAANPVDGDLRVAGGHQDVHENSTPLAALQRRERRYSIHNAELDLIRVAAQLRRIHGGSSRRQGAELARNLGPHPIAHAVFASTEGPHKEAYAIVAQFHV